jgi:rubrerythrin
MVMPDKMVSEIIDMAIQREEEAYAFYMDVYAKVTESTVKDTLEFIAAEEKRHREFLVKYRDGGFGVDSLRMNDPVDYKIAQHLEEPEVKTDMRSEDIYLVAAHRENRSYHFYSDLANLHTSGDLHELLLKIASEELRHKEKMEYLYANAAFPQTAGG